MAFGKNLFAPRQIATNPVKVAREITVANFHEATRATWTPAEVPADAIRVHESKVWAGEKENGEYVASATSAYWVSADGSAIFRKSDHWGCCIRTCDWMLAGQPEGDGCGWNKANKDNSLSCWKGVASCKIADFVSK